MLNNWKHRLEMHSEEGCSRFPSYPAALRPAITPEKEPLKPISRTRKTAGFTLLELIVAIVILIIAMSIAFEAFGTIIRGWKRGMDVAESLTHGDYAMGQLASALDSTIYFYNQRKCYAFKTEKDNYSGYPADMISFVTASGAFMPANSPYIAGPHRLKLYIDSDDNGDAALFAIAMPAIADEEEFEDEFDAQPILVSRTISGLEILFWDKETEEFTDEWEEENSVPERVHITLYCAPEDPNEDPVEFTRVLEIPVFDSVADRLSSPTKIAGAGSASTGRGLNRNPTGGGAPSNRGQISAPPVAQ